jgi:hypothetical protein
MLAVFAVSADFAIILALANGTFQQDAANQVMLLLGFSAFMVVGALIVAHRPSNAIGWVFSAIALLPTQGPGKVAIRPHLSDGLASWPGATRPRRSKPGARFQRKASSDIWCRPRPCQGPGLAGNVYTPAKPISRALELRGHARHDVD